MLSQAFQSAIEQQLQHHFGTSITIQSTVSVSGGDINEALCLALSDGQKAFLKYNHTPLPKLFECEASGLQRLASTKAIRIPNVFAYDEGSLEYPSFLLLEWIEPDRTVSSPTLHKLGQQLARLHQQTSSFYGLEADNYIGSLPQSNQPQDSWIDFYRDQRLGVQLELLKKKGRLNMERERGLNQLMENLDHFIDEQAVQPCLLHGDLWSGNYMASNGVVVLIDPAVYFGHREVEMAFTELFGGFSKEFYAGYNEVWTLPSDYEKRKSLYQLYPLLVHLNLFGETYGSSVDRVLRQYV